jgi:hypothetical protein
MTNSTAGTKQINMKLIRFEYNHTSFWQWLADIQLPVVTQLMRFPISVEPADVLLYSEHSCGNVQCQLNLAAYSLSHIQIQGYYQLVQVFRRYKMGLPSASSPFHQAVSVVIIWIYKMVRIWPGRFVCKQVTVCPGHIGTTLYNFYAIRIYIFTVW